MKNFLKNITKRDISFGIGGLIVGLFVGIYIFTLLVPGGEDMIRLYHSEKNKINKVNTATTTQR